MISPNLCLLAFFLCSAIVTSANAASLPATARKIPTVAETFPDYVNDVTKLKWAHGITSRKALEQALRGDVDMLEADVLLGTIKDQGSTLLPVMAHPPSMTSDLSLREFLQRALSSPVSRGIKLDFKGISVVEEALRLLKEQEQLINVPLWLNADIVNGPVDALSTPLEAQTFLSLCHKYFPNAVLSVGWTTRFGPDLKNPNFVIKEGAYTTEHVQTMYGVLSLAGTTQSVTFPVRAGIAADAESRANLIWLLNQFPDSSLTIWSSPYDTVNVAGLTALIRAVGKHRVYVDVPSGLRCELSSYDSLSSSALSSLMAGRTIRGVPLIAVMTAFACRIIHKPWFSREKI